MSVASFIQDRTPANYSTMAPRKQKRPVDEPVLDTAGDAEAPTDKKPKKQTRAVSKATPKQKAPPCEHKRIDHIFKGATTDDAVSTRAPTEDAISCVVEVPSDTASSSDIQPGQATPNALGPQDCIGDSTFSAKR